MIRHNAGHSIQYLHRQEKVDWWSKKGPILSTFRVKIVHVEVGRWSKMDQILSTETLYHPLVDITSKSAGAKRGVMYSAGVMQLWHPC